MPAVDLQKLRSVLSYDAETGDFTWIGRWSRHSRAQLGAKPGFLRPDGYVNIRVGPSHHKAHRLAWFYVHGTWPARYIDHIDGNRSNNRIANLREATTLQNAHNRGRDSDNKSGFKGVSLHTQQRRWWARIRADGKCYSLGLYDTPEEPHAAYVAAANRLHGEFARAA